VNQDRCDCARFSQSITRKWSYLYTSIDKQIFDPWFIIIFDAFLLFNKTHLQYICIHAIVSEHNTYTLLAVRFVVKLPKVSRCESACRYRRWSLTCVLPQHPIIPESTRREPQTEPHVRPCRSGSRQRESSVSCGASFGRTECKSCTLVINALGNKTRPVEQSRMRHDYKTHSNRWL